MLPALAAASQVRHARSDRKSQKWPPGSSHYANNAGEPQFASTAPLRATPTSARSRPRTGPANSVRGAYAARAAPLTSAVLVWRTPLILRVLPSLRPGRSRPRWAKNDPGVGPAVQPPGSDLGHSRANGTGLKTRSLDYLPPSALQSGVVRDGRPMARKASGVMPSVWVTLSIRPTILFDSVPSAFAVTSLMKTEPVA